MITSKSAVLRAPHQGGALGGSVGTASAGVQSRNIAERREELMNEWQALRERCEKIGGDHWNELRPLFDRFEGRFENFWSQFGGGQS